MSCRHLLREGNAAADFMAKLGAGLSTHLEVFEDLPQGIAPLLVADRRGAVHSRQ